MNELEILFIGTIYPPKESFLIEFVSWLLIGTIIAIEIWYFCKYLLKWIKKNRKKKKINEDIKNPQKNNINGYYRNN